MSTRELTPDRMGGKRLFQIAAWVLGLAVLMGLVVLLLIISFVVAWRNPGLSTLGMIKGLFAVDSVQMWWYITRAAGLVGYILLWLSTAWGLAVSSKIFDPLLMRNYTYDFHQFLSLLAIGFILLHLAVLTLDHYLPFSVIQILAPFTSTYRPLWVGIGIISFYFTLLVTVTFYIRNRIGVQAFRVIHLLSLVAYIGATLHGIYAGTDSSLVTVQWLYKGSFLTVVFLTAFWLIMLTLRKASPDRPPGLEKST
jgi:sulfoxide reductase heme-binding subunit YedZ